MINYQGYGRAFIVIGEVTGGFGGEGGAPDLALKKEI